MVCKEDLAGFCLCLYYAVYEVGSKNGRNFQNSVLLIRMSVTSYDGSFLLFTKPRM